MRKVIVLGIKLDDEAYPNASNTIRILKKAKVQVIDCRVDVGDIKLWSIGKKGTLSALTMTLRIVYSCLTSSILTIVNIAKLRHDVTVYATYPSLLTLLAVRPAKLLFKFQLVCDCYISIWDSMFADRLNNTTSGKSKLIKTIEKVALKGANRIITDSTQNSQYLSKEFKIPLHRFLAFPLAINEDYKSTLPTKNINGNERIDVLFIGTFIPLHGIEVICRAIELINDKKIYFTIIGSGQTAHAFKEDLPSTRWITNWAPLDQLYQYIEKATICLGVFGGTEKAKRVTPFKNYMYLRMGKCIVSQDCYSTPDKCPDLPIESIPSNRPDELANSIIELSKSLKKRHQMGLKA